MTNTHEFNLENAFPHAPNEARRGLRVGIDITQISAIENSFTCFGEHFLRRIFSHGEVAYATAVPAQTAQRLAARFAAKEAAMKAFNLSEAGIGWCDIEVARAGDGTCTLVLHRRAAELVARTGCTEIAVSLSHDGDYATAVVAAIPPRPTRHFQRFQPFPKARSDDRKVSQPRKVEVPHVCPR